jgi:hypothetical protein
MALLATGKNTDFEMAPMGPQQAVCAFVSDIGTHEFSYNGETKQQHQIVISFELAEKMTKGEYSGRPFMLSNFYTLSLHEKSRLSKDLESWFGKKFTPEQRTQGFDLERLIGHNCFLNIIEKANKNGDVNAVIGGIMPLPKNMPTIKVINTKAPEWIDKKRSESLEMKGCAPAPGFADAPVGDGLPF